MHHPRVGLALRSHGGSRVKPLGVFLAATLAPAAIGSDLLEEAKGILQRLGNPGDYGRSLAEKGVREARTAAEGLWPSLDPIYRQRWNEAQAGLAEARRLWSLPMSRPALAPTWSSLEANLTAYGSAMAAVTSARSAYSAAANTRATDALNTAIGDLRRHGDEAVSALRALLPSPVGSRPATKKGRCRDPLTKIEVDCQVPNGPPQRNGDPGSHCDGECRAHGHRESLRGGAQRVREAPEERDDGHAGEGHSGHGCTHSGHEGRPRRADPRHPEPQVRQP